MMSRSGAQGTDPARAYIEATLAGQQTPLQGEPVTPQIDSVIRQLIIDVACEFEEIPGPKKSKIRRVKTVLYPDVLSWVMTTGPLDSVTFYDRNQSASAWYRTKHELRKQRCKYRGNPEIQDILRKIQLTKYRQIKGDSEMGKKQDFLAKIYGAAKSVLVERQGKGRGILGL